MSKHTPGPWSVSTTFGSVGAIQHEGGFVAFPCAPRKADEARSDGESWIDMRDRTQGERDLIAAEQAANARLIAAAPEYHAAADWILQSVTSNAAPVNPIAALQEMALNGQHITLDAGLVLDLLKAHAKATGDQQ